MNEHPASESRHGVLKVLKHCGHINPFAVALGIAPKQGFVIIAYRSDVVHVGADEVVLACRDAVELSGTTANICVRACVKVSHASITGHLRTRQRSRLRGATEAFQSPRMVVSLQTQVVSVASAQAPGRECFVSGILVWFVQLSIGIKSGLPPATAELDQGSSAAASCIAHVE